MTKKKTHIGKALQWLLKQGKTIAPEILNLAGNISGIESLNSLADKIKNDKNINQKTKKFF